MVAAVLPAFLVASLASQIQLGGSAVGLAIAIFHVICAVTSTPAGRLVERIGPRADADAATLTALSCLAIAGLSRAVGAGRHRAADRRRTRERVRRPRGGRAAPREVAVHRQGLAFGATADLGGTIGSLLAGLALPLIAIPFGWRWAFLAVAVLALVAAAVVPYVEPAPSDAVRRPRGLTSVHALAAAAALASAAGVGFISFLILYAVHSGMSEGEAGLLLGAVSLAATASRISVGVLADRRGGEPLRPVAVMLAISIVGYLLLIAGEPALIVVAALLAGAFGWAWPGGLTLAVVQRSPNAGVGGRRADGRPVHRGDSRAARSRHPCRARALRGRVGNVRDLRLARRAHGVGNATTSASASASA